MNKSLKEIQEDTNNQCKEINKTVQYLKLEIKSVKKKKGKLREFWIQLPLQTSMA